MAHITSLRQLNEERIAGLLANDNVQALAEFPMLSAERLSMLSGMGPTWVQLLPKTIAKEAKRRRTNLSETTT